MTSKQTKSNNRINNSIVNNSKESKDNDKESTDGKFDDFTSESLKNLTAEDGSDSESVAVEG